MQSLNDSVDELKSRMAKLDKAIQDLQGQLQNIQNPPSRIARTAAGRSAATSNASARSWRSSGPGARLPPQPPRLLRCRKPTRPGCATTTPAASRWRPGEFQDVLTYYPQDDLAGNAQFYLGEIAYQQKDYAGAVKAYNAVLEGFSGSPKAAAAQLPQGTGADPAGQARRGHSRTARAHPAPSRRPRKPPRRAPS